MNSTLGCILILLGIVLVLTVVKALCWSASQYSREGEGEDWEEVRG